MEDKSNSLSFSEECPQCHKLWYLGFSGFEQGNMLVCYLCPTCNNESMDYMPGVDDSLPKYLAWQRESGEIFWFSGPKLTGVSGEDKIFDGFRDYAEWYTAEFLEDIYRDPSMDMFETIISKTERVYSYNSVYGPIYERVIVTIESNQYAAKVEIVK